MYLADEGQVGVLFGSENEKILALIVDSGGDPRASDYICNVFGYCRY